MSMALRTGGQRRKPCKATKIHNQNLADEPASSVRALPADKLLSSAERRREAFIMRQIVDNRQNSVRALNMELWFERSLGKKVTADASHPDGRNLGK